MQSKKKKILIHSLIFSPDGVSTAYLYNDIALAFQKKGYEVVVLSTTPHFNVVQEQLAEQPMKWGVWGLFKKSCYKGIEVFHVPQKKFKSTLLRLIGFVYWHIVSFFVGLGIKNVDVILSPSPPLTIGLLNLWLAKLKGCEVVYNVQEIYPDILGKKSGVVFNVLSKLERKVYNSSDAVTTIDQVFYDTIAGRFKEPKHLHIIPNFVDTDLYHSGVSIAELDKNLFPETDNIKLLYAGNIGFAQDWEPLVRLAEKTKDLNVEYFLIGEGVRKEYVEENEIERPDDFIMKSIVNKSVNKVFIIQSVDRKLPLEDIADAKNMDMEELLDEIEAIVFSGTKLNLNYYIEQTLDDDIVDEIYDYFKEEAESDSLADAMEDLGSDYDEQEVRLVRIKFLCEVAN